MELIGTIFDWFRSHPAATQRIVFASILLAFVYTALMLVAIARMEPHYFVTRKPPRESFRGRHPVARFAVKGMKSVVGLVQVIMGLAMLVLPGQGMLTILIGVSLLDFPGKRRLELRFVRQPQVLKAINWIRAKAKQPALIIPKP